MALDVGELRATLTLDRGDFDSDLDKAQTQFRQLGQTAERSGQQAENSFSGVGAGVRRETDQAEQSVRRLGQSGEQAGRDLGTGITSGASAGLRGLSGAAGAAGTQAGGAAGAGAEAGMAARLARLGAAGGPVGIAIMAVAAVGITVGTKLADNIMAGLEKQALANRDRVKFGWTEAQAAAAGKAAADAYGNAWGDSVGANREAAGIAIQNGLLDGNATAAEIQPIIEKLNVVTDIMGTEIPETARAAGQMVRTGLAKDAGEALDILTAAQQNGLNVSGDLLDTITEYGTQYRKLGLDGATALGTIQQMMQGGARDTDVAADALKEFSDKVLDGSKTTTGAFEMLGLDAEATATAFGKGGKSASDMTQIVWNALQGVQDQVKRNEIGVALFGEKWIDLGAAINGMDLSTAAGALGEVNGAAQRASDGMGGAAADIQAAKNKVSIAMDEIQMKLADAFGPQLAQAAQWVSEHTEEISRAFEITGGVIGMVAGAVGVVGGTIVGVVGEIIEHTAKLVRGVLGPVFAGMEKLGGMMAKLPGVAGEMGRSLLVGAATGREWINTWAGAGETMSDFGWDVARAGNSVGLASADIAKGTEKAKTATQAFGDLGIKVREVPDQKRIVIEDNSPETLQKLKDLGIKVETLPDGSVYIDAQDEDAKAKIADLTKPEVKTIVVTTTQAKVGQELSEVNKIRVANGMAPLTSDEFGTGSAGAGVGGTGLSSTGQKITVKVAGAPPAPAKPATPIHKTTAEKEDDQKAADKVTKAADAAKKKTEAAEAAEKKKTEAADKKAADAQAKIPGLQSALAIAEQRVRELKPNATASSRMSAEQSVTKAREALAAAQQAAKAAPATTKTGADGKPVTVTGDGTGGVVNVGTDGKPVQVEPSNGAQGDGLRVFVTNMPAGGVGGGGIKLSLFAGGGAVSGPGSGTSDSIPAMLSDGEFVVNAEQTARFGGLLTAINSGRVQRFADGGPVNGLQPGAASLRKIIMDQFGITDIGGFREADGYNEHSTGRALDVMVNDAAKGTAVKNFVISNAKALGLKWAIWQQAMWYPDGTTTGMEDRGSPTQNHMDHVHVFLDEGANTNTFSLEGGGAETGGNADAPIGSREWLAAKLMASGLTATQTRGILAMNKVEGGEDDPKSLLGLTEEQAISLGGQAGPEGHLAAFLKLQWNDKARRGADGSMPGVDVSGTVTDEKAYLAWIQEKIVGQTGAATDWQGNAQPAASEYGGRLAAAYAEIPTPAGSITGGGSGTGTTGTTDPKATTGTTGGVQDVRVTNWPSNLGGNTGPQFKFSMFADGGHVRGPGSATSDSIPAMLSDGEYVINAASTRANYPLLEAINRSGGVLHLAGGGGIGVAPKIEAPKITPTIMPGGPIPIPAATPTVGAAATPGLDPLAGATGIGQSAVPGTGDAVSGKDYALQRTMQLGGDLAKIGIEALKGILLPSGLDSQQAANVVGLIKGVGGGIKASAEKAESSKTTKTADGKTTNITNNHTWNVSSADEAYRNIKRDEGRKALTYDGSLP